MDRNGISWTRIVFYGLILTAMGGLAIGLQAFGADPAGSGITSAPLADRTGGENLTGPVFEMMDGSRTGIDFAHMWTPPHQYRERIDSSFVTAGVTIGDYDGDGLADVYMTRSFGGSKLYRNLGDFRFEDVTESAGLADVVAWDTGPAFADVDSDGDLDLYVSCHESPNRLYLNQGDGTFKNVSATAGLDFNGASIMMSFADYDLDGDLDAYLLTNRRLVKFDMDVVTDEWKEGRWQMDERLIESIDLITRKNGQPHLKRGGQFDHLYRNNGDGTFTEVTEEAGIYGNDLGLSATWWDYNADGKVDLYVGNDFMGADKLYHNNGDGTFTDVIAEKMPHTPWFSMGANIADVNNDGRIDMMIADMSATTHYKAKLTMGDMDSLGWFLEYPTPRQYMKNALYLNSGTGRFMEAASLAHMSSTDWTWAPKTGDLDCDGYVDLFFSNGMSRYWMNSDFVQMTTAMTPQEMRKAKADFFDNGPKQDEANLAFRNHGDLHFENVSKAWGLDHFGVSFGAAYGDLDNDGDLDLVVMNMDEPASVYRNNGTTGHRLKIRLEGTTSHRWGVGATVRAETGAGTQTRYMTLARGFMAVDESLVHFGTGDDQTVRRLTVEWPSGHRQTFEDVAADRFYTITEPTGVAPQVMVAAAETMFEPAASSSLKRIRHREVPYHDFKRQPLLPNKLSQLGPGLAWGDVDGDGDDDLFVGGAAGSAGLLRINRGDGKFGVRVYSDIQDDYRCEDMAPLFFDADGDNDLDLYVVSGGYEFEADDELLQDRLYLNDGAGAFTRAPEGTLPMMLDSGGTAVAADFDRDGDLDLFVGGRVIPGAYPATPKSYLLRNDGGRFTDVTGEAAIGLQDTGLVTSAVWSDADGDGWQDLMVTHEWGPVKLWRNNQGQFADITEKAGLSYRTGWYNGIAAGDVDNDGDMDYVVTNFGLNTKYHASKEHPTLLYYGDFDQSGTPHLVEAKIEDGKHVPRRGKSCSQNAMSMVRENFPTFAEFAAAGLEEIYTAECLEDATLFSANSLESGVWLNDGEARFTFEALPHITQISPGFGVVMTEVNGDGFADVYLVQNFFSPQRETGHMDGGLSQLLLGNGDGTFEVVWPDRSGMVVPEDAMGLATTDLNGDGWPDFVIGINNGPLRAFINQGHETHRVFSLRLAGESGNAAAVGARVTATLDDGTTRTAEVRAGSSYLSQSSADVVFGLGTDRSVQTLDVRWPSGVITRHEPKADRVQISLEDGAPVVETSAR